MDFLEAIGVDLPKDLYQNISEKFTLFSFSPQNSQLGFIAEIKNKENLKNALNEIELEIKTRIEPIFSLFGSENFIALHPVKKQEYLGETFSYISFNQTNLGICYGLVKNYFIFATSGEVMLKLIEYKAEITKNLKEGDQGIEIKILQTWLAKDPQFYPEKKITGVFDAPTKEAVIRFQQKFAEELLQATGIVDEKTKEKLNKTYKK